MLARSTEKAKDLVAKGIKVKIGDYNDHASLVAAFQGADKLFLISGSDLHNCVEQHRNAINAAKEAGVKHFIYTSFLRKNKTETSPVLLFVKQQETEKILKSSGIPHTILFNSIYAGALPGIMGEKVLETGIFLTLRKAVKFILRMNLYFRSKI